ncbi:hypothetical protein CIK02_01405 [Pseudomonas putida]|nr:hypothetical protein CIK02_01405 [Pseudomonas putida]
MCCLRRPFRGHARFHRFTTGARACAVPVGAGVPANGPQSGPRQRQRASTSGSCDRRWISASGA